MRNNYRPGSRVRLLKDIKDAYQEVWHKKGDVVKIKSITDDGVGLMFDSDLGTHYTNVEPVKRQASAKKIYKELWSAKFPLKAWAIANPQYKVKPDVNVDKSKLPYSIWKAIPVMVIPVSQYRELIKNGAIIKNTLKENAKKEKNVCPECGCPRSLYGDPNAALFMCKECVKHAVNSGGQWKELPK